MTVRTVHVAKSDLTAAQIVDTPPGPLADGALRLRVETFAVTANNVTYALFGEQMAYWNFFPAPEGFGIVPMWGHAVVEASNVDGIAAGERVYGYLPMGTHLDVLPGKVSRGGFTDMAPHRQPMSPIYNQYSRLAADPEHAPDKEAERMIFAPLFKTGFLIESFMRREGWFGAQALIMTSASSKTAMGLASVARARSPEIERVGLTSAANANFVADSGMYDRVLAYADIGELPDVPSVSVDFAATLRSCARCTSGSARGSPIRAWSARPTSMPAVAAPPRRCPAPRRSCSSPPITPSPRSPSSARAGSATRSPKVGQRFSTTSATRWPSTSAPGWPAPRRLSSRRSWAAPIRPRAS